MLEEEYSGSTYRTPVVPATKEEYQNVRALWLESVVIPFLDGDILTVIRSTELGDTKHVVSINRDTFIDGKAFPLSETLTLLINSNDVFESELNVLFKKVFNTIIIP